MNRLQEAMLRNYVSNMLIETEFIPTALYEALDTADKIFVEDILDLVQYRKYSVSDEMNLSVESIDEILEYARNKKLDLTLGFGSVLESYVLSELGLILKIDLLEMM